MPLDSINYFINALRKIMNHAPLLRVMSKIEAQTWLFNLARATNLEEGKTLTLKPKECYQENLCHTGAHFFCYQLIQKLITKNDFVRKIYR